MIDLKSAFKKYEDEEGHTFDRVVNPPSRRPDLCAFMLLDRLVPLADGKKTDMVISAGHDEIWLGVDCDALARVATDDDILMLVRCGVCYDDNHEGLYMFV